MYRFLSIIVVFVLFLLLVSCNTKKIDAQKITTNIEPEVLKQTSSHSNSENMETPYYIKDIQDDYIGTYLPQYFIETFDKTKSYLSASKNDNQNLAYDVLAVNKNIIYSNVKFHDQYAIESQDIQKYIFYKDEISTVITDNNGILYTKISNDPDYYRVVSKYVMTNFLKNISIESDPSFSFSDEQIIYQDIEFTVVLDSYLIPLDDNLLIMNSDKLIGLQIKDEYLYLYNAIPDEELRYKNDKVINQYSITQK